jgi:hypothetical protein
MEPDAVGMHLQMAPRTVDADDRRVGHPADVAAGAAPTPDVAAGAAPTPDVAAGAAP